MEDIKLCCEKCGTPIKVEFGKAKGINRCACGKPKGWDKLKCDDCLVQELTELHFESISTKAWFED